MSDTDYGLKMKWKYKGYLQIDSWIFLSDGLPEVIPKIAEDEKNKIK